MDVDRFLSDLTAASWYRDQLVHVERVPPREARSAQPSHPLQPSLVEALHLRGVWPLYLHQAQAVDALARGENVVVATPAASGKSLCYHLPVMDSLLSDRTARALYLFPTKALTQDQLRSFKELSHGLGPFRAEIFDGDTPTHERASIRRGAQVVLTNPDMLHLGILPNHRAWARFFHRLRYVVVDEAHVYRGVFGSHVAALLRRLRRVCGVYGASPQFVLASATIGNPKELAERLMGLPFTLVDEDGAPYGGKRFVFWNPPVVDEEKMARRSASAEAAQLFSELVLQEVRTIVFVRSRRLAELVHLYAREQLRYREPSLARRISPYRASYLPEQRREIEQALFRGDLVGVSATTALELGIDVGDLDATVIAGYPGTIASTWQQAGRSGRRGKESFSALVAQDNPLDQYLMRHPGAFFGRPVERALVSPENPHVLQPHLLCAAYEAPLIEADMALFGPATAQHVASLVELGLLRKDGLRWHLRPDVSYPAEKVNIRSTSPDTYVVVEEGSGVVIETVEESQAFFQLHDGAVYLHQGEPYLVKRLDRDTRTAYVAQEDVPYYTQCRDVTDIRVLKPWKSKHMGEVTVCLGEVEVSTLVVGYQKRKPYTEEVLAEEFLDLPPLRFNTVALWFDISPTVLARLLRDKRDLAGGLHAAEHAAIGVLPLFAMCDRWDIGGVSTPLHPDTGHPQVFIYDGHPGGVGIAEEGYERIEELWRATLRAVAECPCRDGCPSCIQSPKCGNNNEPLDKQVAIEMLHALVAAAERA